MTTFGFIEFVPLFVNLVLPSIRKDLSGSQEYDTPSARQELADVFAELGIKWKWQPITFENMHEVVEEVASSNKEYVPVVLNYCAGDEDPNFPGTCVIKLLEAKGILFTGADSTFDYLGSSKLRMKRAFVEADVATAPYGTVHQWSRIYCIPVRFYPAARI
jgi:D-alanine-D-alanine ligase